MTVSENEKNRFTDLVKLRLNNRRFLPESQEVDLLQDGVSRLGMSLDEARGILRSVAEDRGAALQRDVEDAVGYMLRDASDRKSRLKRRDFERARSYYALRANGGLGEDEIRRRLKAIMQDEQLQPARAGLLRTKRWYNKIA